MGLGARGGVLAGPVRPRSAPRRKGLLTCAPAAAPWARTASSRSARPTAGSA